MSVDFHGAESEKITTEPLERAGARPFGRGEPSVVMPNCLKPLSQARPRCRGSAWFGDQSRVDTSTFQWYKRRTWRRGKLLFLLQFGGSRPNPFLGTIFPFGCPARRSPKVGERSPVVAQGAPDTQQCCGIAPGIDLCSVDTSLLIGGSDNDIGHYGSVRIVISLAKKAKGIRDDGNARH